MSKFSSFHILKGAYEDISLLWNIKNGAEHFDTELILLKFTVTFS